MRRPDLGPQRGSRETGAQAHYPAVEDEEAEHHARELRGAKNLALQSPCYGFSLLPKFRQSALPSSFDGHRRSSHALDCHLKTLPSIGLVGVPFGGERALIVHCPDPGPACSGSVLRRRRTRWLFVSKAD